MKRALLASALVFALAAGPAAAQDTVSAITLRLGGKEIPLPVELRARLTGLAREILSVCGPNTRHHPHNFGLAATLASERRQRVLEGSRLHVVFDPPFKTVSHLGGTLAVSEATIGLEDRDLFVGPDFTRHGGRVVEHLQCRYLPSLELACLPELGPYLPARYKETCAKLERDAEGRIIMPPPDIAPSCS